jgi:hypothetical protein
MANRTVEEADVGAQRGTPGCESEQITDFSSSEELAQADIDHTRHPPNRMLFKYKFHFIPSPPLFSKSVLFRQLAPFRYRYRLVLQEGW